MIAASDFLSIHPANALKSKHFSGVAQGSFAEVLANQDKAGAKSVPDGGKILPDGELPDGSELPLPLPQFLDGKKPVPVPAPEPALVNMQAEGSHPLAPVSALADDLADLDVDSISAAAPLEDDAPEADQPQPDVIVPLAGSEPSIAVPGVKSPGLSAAVTPPPISPEPETSSARSALRGKDHPRHNGKRQTPEEVPANSRSALGRNSELPRIAGRILPVFPQASPAPQVPGVLPARKGVQRSDAAAGNPGMTTKAEQPSARPARAEFALDMKAASILAPTIGGANADAPAPPVALQATDITSKSGTEAALRFGPDNGGQAQPQDFGSLVERLAEAREAARSQTVRMALPHADFGEVSLRFRQDDRGLSVAMSSADPEFSRAVQAAMPAERAHNGQDNPQTSHRDDTMRQSAADHQEGHAQQSAQSGGTQEADHILAGQTPTSDDNSQAGSSGDGRGGIFA